MVPLGQVRVISAFQSNKIFRDVVINDEWRNIPLAVVDG